MGRTATEGNGQYRIGNPPFIRTHCMSYLVCLSVMNITKLHCKFHLIFFSFTDYKKEDIPVDPVVPVAETVVAGDSGVGNDSNERDGINTDGGGHVGRGDVLLAQHKL